MLLTWHPLAHLQHLFLKPYNFSPSTEIAVARGKVVHVPESVRVLLTHYALPYLQHHLPEPYSFSPSSSWGAQAPRACPYQLRSLQRSNNLYTISVLSNAI